MRSASLHSIKIEHLWGSLTPFELIFDKSKSLMIIYGENGSGKSSICDAIEFLSKGQIGSLNDRGLGRTTPYWISHGKTHADVLVTLVTGTGTCQVRMAKNGSAVWLGPVTQPNVEIFRKAQIRMLVEAAPAKRYEAVQRFVDVGGIEKSEDTLRTLIRELSRNREIAIAEVAQNEAMLQQFWHQAGSPGTSWLAWAEAQEQNDPSELAGASSAISRLIGNYESLRQASDRLKRAQLDVEQARIEVAEAREQVNASAQHLADGAGELLTLLSAAHDYFALHGEVDRCPVCDSNESVSGLPARVAARIGTLEDLQSLQQVAAVRLHTASVAETRLSEEQKALQEQVQAFEQARNDERLPAGLLDGMPKLVADQTELDNWLVATSAYLERWQHAAATHRERSDFLGVLANATLTWRTNRESQEELDALLPRLARTLQIIEEERRRYSDQVLTSIAEEVGRLYEQVHPGEGLNKVSLQLDAKKRASLELAATFRGEVLPPPAYFSDSHLDTLGVCIFLALTKRENPENVILVLDDVVGSVDEPHVDRLVQMIYDESKNFRYCVLTTHYRPWREKFRWGFLKNGQCQFVELGEWCPTNGVSIIGTGLSDVLRLRVLLAEKPPDMQLVCAKAGVVLEAMLDFLTQRYECPVPRRASGRYTLGDLLPAIDSKLRQSLQVDVKFVDPLSRAETYQTTELRPLLEQLNSIVQTRNIFGAHFNDLSFEALDRDALQFAEMVEELSALLMDDDSGWPKSDKSGSYWATPGETRRLHPLRRPG